MKTKIFDESQIRKASKLIRKGELVAFPTETVYGLGANALDKNAVKKIFEVKNRPLDNPLIVHISRKEEINKIAETRKTDKEKLKKLTDKFWPGPLTIILEKKKNMPKETTANLESVAIRMPRNKTALKLIKYSEVPIAAPSANLSGKPSGTKFEHVLDDLNRKISGIIKSKNCEIGLESTVVDLTSHPFALLRPGAISFEDLKKILPEIEKGFQSKRNIAKSPGMKYRHYSPNAKIILFEKSAEGKIEFYKKKYSSKNKKIRTIYPEKTRNLSKRLFSFFRECDKENVDYIFISSVNEEGIGLALMDRVRKAASKIIK